MSEETKGRFERVVDTKGRRVPYLFRYRPTGMLYVVKNFKKEGIPALYEPTGETGLGAAQTARDVIIQRHRNRHLGIQDEHVFGVRAARPFSRAIAEVLRVETPKRRPETQKKHRRILPILDAALGDLDIELVYEAGLEWLEKRKREYPGRLRGEYTKHLNLVMRYAHQKMRHRGRPYAMHLVEFENPDGRRPRIGRVFSPKEMRGLWLAAQDEMKDRLALATPNGLRRDEMRLLTWDRVNLKSGKVTLRDVDVKTGNQTGRGREIILSDQAIERLRARFDKRATDSPWVFPSRKDPRRPTSRESHLKMWGRLKTRAGTRGRARWHDLRHHAITEALHVRKVRPLDASEYYGVSLATIQRRYLHTKAEHTRGVTANAETGGEE